MRANEFIVEYKLSVSKDADGVAVKATAGGKQLGHAEFFFDDEGQLDPQTVWVDERYHGQGIARDMYDHLKDLGYTIVRSWDQTDAGAGFWNKHRGEDARVWESEQTPAEKFIADIYDEYPQTFQNNHVIPFSSEEFAMFELKPSTSRRGAVEVYWFQAYPLRSGVGSRAMKILQDRAREHGVALTLVPWDKGQVSQAALTKFYKRQGFKPTIKGGRSMSWEPLEEISRDRLERYLSRAGRQVDTRQERIARARQRLNTSYEIYHAEQPTKIVDRFEADTPADAQRYYQDYIERYESDVDYDLRLRRGTGIMEFAPSPERDNNDDVPDPIFVLANRWWNAAEKQPQIESVLNSMGWSIHQVESEDDAVQLQHRDGTTYFISADDFDPDVFEDVDQAQPEVYLDMDGVLADFMAGYNRVAGTNYKPGQQLPHPSEDPTLKKITGTNFFSTLPKFASADALVRMVVDQYGHYNICSSPLRGDHENSAANKRAWLTTNLQPQPREIVITARKEKHAVQPDGTPNILVDDKPENIQRWQDAGGIGILYNAAVDGLDTVAAGLQLNENFADGKKPGRKGLSRRVGIPKKATLAQLQKIASSSTGERRRMAQWQLNMRRGKAKKNK